MFLVTPKKFLSSKYSFLLFCTRFIQTYDNLHLPHSNLRDRQTLSTLFVLCVTSILALLNEKN